MARALSRKDSPPLDRRGGHVPGLGGGVRIFFEGMGFIVGTPSLWAPALVPVAMALVLTGALGALGVWGAIRTADGLLVPEGSALVVAGAWVLRVVFVAIAILFALVLALTFAAPLSGWALDRIVRRQEEELGVPPWPELPFVASMFRSLQVTLAGLVLTLPFFVLLTLVELLFPPVAVVTLPLKLVLTALLAAYDFLDYPLSLRGFGVCARLAWIGRHFGAVLGFGVSAALLLFIPFIGLLVLPMGVAGATRLVVEAEPDGNRHEKPPM